VPIKEPKQRDLLKERKMPRRNKSFLKDW